MVYFNSNNSNSNSGSNNAGKESSGQNSIIYILLFGFALFLMVYIIYTYFRPSQVSKGYTDAEGSGKNYRTGRYLETDVQ